MNRAGQCAVVIPCWNEAVTIGPLVGRAQRHLPDVIVVDDGSTDATASLARAAGARVEGHPRNLGKGAALRTGLARAVELGFTCAITLDGDGQHPPEAIPAFLERAALSDAALIVGNRMADAARMPWLRRAVNRWMSRQLARQAEAALPDSQCGFRLVRLEAWRRFRLECDHFEAESELILAFARAGLPIGFVPIRAVPSPRPSRIRPLQDTLRWLRWWHGVAREPRLPAAGCAPRTACFPDS